MPSKFEKWWENTGYDEAKKLDILNDPVEIARLAYKAGLYTSPFPLTPIGKSTDFYFKSHMVKCNCGCQTLEVERYDYKDGDEGFNIVIWNRGHDGNKIRGWKEKFRWCWDILTTGKPWADSIIATNNDAKELANFILQTLPKEDSHEETKK